ncbi:MAG: cytochrome C, partial [Chitinophagaceae bacterium]
FDLDTGKLVDGSHTLKIISKDPTGKEGIRLIPFEVRNGPAISIEGIKENAIVDGILPIMINAYGKGDQKKFLIEGSETPQSIPAWVWILIIGIGGWVTYYLIAYLNMKQ